MNTELGELPTLTPKQMPLSMLCCRAGLRLPPIEKHMTARI